MKNNKILISSIYGIVSLFIVTLSFVFVGNYDGRFWGSNIFLILSVAYAITTSILYTKTEDKNVVRDMGYLTISTSYVVAVFLYNFIGDWGWRIFNYPFLISTKVYIAIHFLIVVISIIATLALKLGSNHMDAVYKESDSAVKKIKLLSLELEEIKSKINFDNPELQKKFGITMDNLVDLVKYSDPISIPELKDIEDEIHTNISTLKTSEDFAVKISIVEKITELFELRNKKLKILK